MKVEIRVHQDAKVLLLEDNQERIDWFMKRLAGLKISLARTAYEAINYLAKEQYSVLFLDHDLGLLPVGPEGNGYQVAKHIVNTGYLAKSVVIHSWNTVGAASMAKLLQNAVVIPYGRFEIKVVPG